MTSVCFLDFGLLISSLGSVVSSFLGFFALVRVYRSSFALSHPRILLGFQLPVMVCCCWKYLGQGLLKRFLVSIGAAHPPPITQLCIEPQHEYPISAL